MTLSSAMRLLPSYTPRIHDGFANCAFAFELGHPNRRGRGVRRVGGHRDPFAAVLFAGARAEALARVGWARSGASRRVGAARERRGCRARATDPAGLAGRPRGAPGTANNAGGRPPGGGNRRGTRHASGAWSTGGERPGHLGSSRPTRLHSSGRGCPRNRRPGRTWSFRPAQPRVSRPRVPRPRRAFARRRRTPGRRPRHHSPRERRGGNCSYGSAPRWGGSPHNLIARRERRHNIASRIPTGHHRGPARGHGLQRGLGCGSHAGVLCSGAASRHPAERRGADALERRADPPSQ
jgi:hypothetical protein